MTLREWCEENNRLDILAEWHPTKNGDLTVDNVTSSSGQNIWWYLPYDDPVTGKHFDFEWRNIISNRTKRGDGCPYLCGKAVFHGYNDLATLMPDLAKEWHPTKNGRLTPKDITTHYGKKVWWYLPYDDPETGKHFNFEWQTTVDSRVGNNLGCPYISNKSVWVGYNDLETTHPDIAQKFHPTKNGTLTPKDFTYGSGKIVWWLYRHYDMKTDKWIDLEWKA